mmetsp:Transcript_113714/g.321575  ORF Transcript_113714/g.321575 Transcript_113714/m.321575 type:complete len:229 (-) Transcript_113714:297-983(-)
MDSCSPVVSKAGDRGEVAPSADEGGTDEAVGDEGLFSVDVTSIIGDTFTISDLKPDSRYRELCSKVSEAAGILPHEVQLSAGSRVYGQAELHEDLQSLGIAGDMLTFSRRSIVRLCNPGVSRFNRDYCCTVLRVEEVGWGMLEIEFEVVGDMSLGELQDPRSSTLSWHGSDGEVIRRKPDKFVWDHDDRRAHIKGSLSFTNVPIVQGVCFEYGHSGYAKLPLAFFEGE